MRNVWSLRGMCVCIYCKSHLIKFKTRDLFDIWHSLLNSFTLSSVLYFDIRVLSRALPHSLFFSSWSCSFVSQVPRAERKHSETDFLSSSFPLSVSLERKRRLELVTASHSNSTNVFLWIKILEFSLLVISSQQFIHLFIIHSFILIHF